MTWESKGKEDHWNTLPETSQSRKLIRYSEKRTRKFLELSKPELRRITGLLTGHCTLRHHLKKMGKTTDDTCRLCFEEKETAKHVLCECVAVARITLKHFGKGFMSLNDLSGVEPKRTLHYMNEIDLGDI